MPIRDEEAFELLTIARVSLLIKEPFFGVLAMNLELVEVDIKTAERMTTAAVDGRRPSRSSAAGKEPEDVENGCGVRSWRDCSRWCRPTSRTSSRCRTGANVA